MEIKTVEEGNARVQKILEKVVNSLNLKHPPSVKRIAEQDKNEKDDDYVQLDNWIIISSFDTEENRPRIGKPNNKVKAIHYQVSVVKVIHGIHMRWDGTGEPDDVEVIPTHDDLDTPAKAVEAAMEVWIKNHIDNVMEDISLGEMEE